MRWYCTYSISSIKLIFKGMVFSKGSHTIKIINFIINSKNIEIVKEFKYLGITVKSRNCTFTPTLSDLSSKANKAVYSLLSRLPIKIAPSKTMVKPFDTCIVPILLYGSEVWPPFMNHHCIKWEVTQTEKIHTQFLKRLLGVNTSTTNVLIRGELGRHSLQEEIATRNIRYVKYVENKDSHTYSLNRRQATNHYKRLSLSLSLSLAFWKNTSKISIILNQ